MYNKCSKLTLTQKNRRASEHARERMLRGQFQIEVLKKYLNLGYDLLDQYDKNIIQKMFTLFHKIIYS